MAHKLTIQVLDQGHQASAFIKNLPDHWIIEEDKAHITLSEMEPFTVGNLEVICEKNGCTLTHEQI